jgi:Cdc6-like AAA superfamily ATPase
MDEIKKQRDAANDQKAALDAQLEKLVSDSLEVNMPPALKDEKRDNIILLGPPSCGKTTAINFLSQEQQRGIIRLDNLFDFFTKRGSPLADEAAAFLAQREQDLKVA